MDLWDGDETKNLWEGNQEENPGAMGLDLPCDLVTAGHGEQALPLQHPVPGLDGVAGPHGDGPLPRLDLGPQLAPRLPVGVPVALVWKHSDNQL